MGVPFDRQRQLELDAQAEAEAQFEFENSQKQSNSGGLGADYNLSYGGQAGKATKDFLPAALQSAMDAGTFLDPYSTTQDQQGNTVSGGPIDTIMRAGPEKTAETVGGLSSGLAGALGGAEIGAGIGAFGGPFDPFTIPLGAILGGGAGFGAGLTGFNVLSDAGTNVVNDISNNYIPNATPSKDYVRPYDQYLKDFAYNATQGSLFGGAGELAKVPYRPIKNAVIDNIFTNNANEARVVNTLNDLAPGYATQVDQALPPIDPNQPPPPPDGGGGGPAIPILGDYRSLGELINNDTVKNAQRTASKTDSGSIGASLKADQVRADAQLRFLDQLAEPNANPADVQTAIQDVVNNKDAAATQAIDAAKNNVDAAVGNLQSPIESSAAGNLMRESLQNSKDALRADVTAHFNASGDGVIDPAPARVVAETLMPKYFREVGAQPSQDLLNLVSDLNRSGEPITTPEGKPLLDSQGQPIIKPVDFTLKDSQALRSKALQVASSGDLKVAAIAKSIADGLTVAEDNAVKAGTLTADQVSHLHQGRALRLKQGNLYESAATPTKSILKTQPGNGAYAISDSVVPGKVFRAGDRGVREGIRNYKSATGGSGAALEPLYQYATESFRNEVVDGNGVVNSTKANSWLRRHAAALDQLPDLKNQLSDVHSRQQFLNEKYGDLKRSQADADHAALQSILRADPEKIAGAMLSGKDMVKRTMATVQYLKTNAPHGLPGLRRAIIEHLKNKAFIPSQAGGVNAALQSGDMFQGYSLGGTLVNELRTIRPALERSGLFTKSQLDGFDQLYNDKMSQLSVQNARTKGGSDTGEIKSVLNSLLEVGTDKFIKNIPFGDFIYNKIIPILRKIPMKTYKSTLEQALLDPRLARDLQNKVTARNFSRTALGIFKDQFDQAFGAQSPGSALYQGAMSASPYTATVIAGENKANASRTRTLPTIPKQQTVTAKQSFPNPQDLLTPPAPGELKKISFNPSTLEPEVGTMRQMESQGNAFALSRKGAKGDMQLMDATAQELATKNGEVYTPASPDMNGVQLQAAREQNIRLGNQYLQQMKGQFKNNTLAWAAYNAGPGRVREAMAMAGTTRDVNKIIANLPKETRDYANKLARKFGSA